MSEQTKCGLASHRNEMLTHATTGTNLGNFMPSKVSQSQSHMLHESTYVQADPRQKDGGEWGKAA